MLKSIQAAMLVRRAISSIKVRFDISSEVARMYYQSATSPAEVVAIEAARIDLIQPNF